MIRKMTEHDIDAVVGLMSKMYEESINYHALSFSISRVEDTKLVRSFVIWAKGRGAKLILNGVSAGIDNDAAIKLYELVGFKRVGSAMMMEV